MLVLVSEMTNFTKFARSLYFVLIRPFGTILFEEGIFLLIVLDASLDGKI